MAIVTHYLTKRIKKLQKLFLTMQFGIELNENQLCLMYISQRAKAFVKTHTLLKSSVQYQVVDAPWLQKKDGRSRQGSIRSPQWRGGGVVFGPTPRSYCYKLPQKVRRLALKSVYSDKKLLKTNS